MAYKVQDGYQKFHDKEPLILEPDDWSFSEWATICKLCGLPLGQTERIVLHANDMECFVDLSKKILDSERTYTVVEVCPHCESEIEMRWNTDAQGFKAFCPVCGNRLMLCDECRHVDVPIPCDYDSQTDSCHRNPGKIVRDDTEQAKRVVIVVEGGAVESVYAEDKLVDVEIVDKYGDDGDRRGWIDEAAKELHEDIASGKLVSVY